MNSRKKVLFVKRHDANAKFVTNDIEILRKNFEVEVDEVEVPKSAAILLMFAVRFTKYLFRIPATDLIYIWFADYHSMLPVLLGKLFGRPVVICAGGYEATYIPEIDMGVYSSATFRKRMRRFCTSFSLRNCSLILPVDDSLIENTNSYIYSSEPGRKPLKDGIKNMLPGIRTSMRTVRLGYDPEIFKRNSRTLKERAVVAAGFIMNKYEYSRKGFDVLVRCAELMPDVRFILIGLNEEHKQMLDNTGPKNLELYGKSDYEGLIKLYSRAKVYAQLSLFEGMPSSVCEAMLCECIPVGSRVNGIPGIIGDSGIVVDQKDITLIAESLNNALNLPDENGVKARHRIESLFSIPAREKEIADICRELLSVSGN